MGRMYAKTYKPDHRIMHLCYDIANTIRKRDGCKREPADPKTEEEYLEFFLDPDWDLPSPQCKPISREVVPLQV